MSGDIGTTDAVELRVHGVSGTPAEQMLQCPTEYLDRVSGDRSAGFYECRPCGEKDPAERIRMAYSWGGLTSGPATRGLWLLFLPFLLINLAHWMLPPSTMGTRAANVAVTVLRLLALSLTLTFLLASVQMMVDIVGWQCSAISRCGEQLGPLSFLTRAGEGQRIAVTAAPVMFLLGAVLLLGRANPAIAKRAETPTAEAKRPPKAAVVESGDLPLQDKNFWNPDQSVRRMRGCHVIAWMSSLAALIAAVPLQYLDESSVLESVCVGLVVVNTALLVVAVGLTCSTTVTGRGGVSSAAWTKRVTCLVGASVLVCVGTLATVWFADSEVHGAAQTHLPILRDTIYLLLVVQAVLVAAAFAATAWCTRNGQSKDDGWSPTLRGFGAPVVATIALLAGGGFSAGVGLLSAQYMGTPVPTTKEARVANYAIETPLILPPGYFVAALVFFGLLVLFAIQAAYIWFCVRRKLTEEWIPALAQEYSCSEDDKRVKAVAEARAVAELVDYAPTVLARFTGVAVFAMLSIGVTFAAVEAAYGFDRVPISVPVVSTLSVAAITAAAAAIVGLAVGAFRNRRQRRVIGILWDVITFWPRANHPLTPPCYAERTVPDLGDELRYLLSRRQPVVLSAHSQGTIIAAATLLQLGNNGSDVALLTFGCPLRRLYGRNFPAYFNRQAMDVIAGQRTGRWLNLWAHTDPIGGWVCREGGVVLQPACGEAFLFDLDTIDNRLLDASSVEVLERGGYPPVCRHSGFWTRAEYDPAIEELLIPGRGPVADPPA